MVRLCTNKVAHQGEEVNDLALSPDSQRLVSAGDGTTGALAVWDISNGVHEVAALDGHTAGVTTCVRSPYGVLIPSAARDGTVRVWDSQTFNNVPRSRTRKPCPILEACSFPQMRPSQHS